ncbi:MAG: hypothetical protein ACLFM8_05285, partial [Halobacteriales archaeon]
MVTDLDLREPGVTTDDLVEILDDAPAGEHLHVIAESDLDPLFVRYQLDRGRRLDWTHDDPDAEPRSHRVTVGS